MNLATVARKQVEQAGRALVNWFQRKCHGGPRDLSEGPEVFAVTNCYPTRIVLYAAAFQGGWKLHFMKSLREALEATHSRRPKAVFYDHHVGDPVWDQYCTSFSHMGVPFVLLAHKTDDETFLVVLAAGGYQAWGDPLTSEEVVKAVDFASDMAGLAPVPVMQG
jgi:hypothetical protein